MLAELRETTIRRLGELLDAAPDVADQIAALERAGVAPEKLFAAALKRRGAAPAARPPALDGSWAAALRTGRVAASLHSLVVVVVVVMVRITPPKVLGTVVRIGSVGAVPRLVALAVVRMLTGVAAVEP